MGSTAVGGQADHHLLAATLLAALGAGAASVGLVAAEPAASDGPGAAAPVASRDGGTVDGTRDAPRPRCLDVPVRAHWKALPLGDWVERVTRIAGRPVVLDRRIDPDRPVTLDCDGESLGVVLERVADQAGAAVDVLDSSIRLVPAADRGRASAAERRRGRELAASRGDLRRRVLAREPWRWSDGSTPRELVGDAARVAGIEIDDLDLVPHDHLRSMTLPPLTLGERLDLVLAHYDLRTAWGSRPRIVAMEAADAGTPASPAGIASGVRRPRPGTGGVEVFTLRLEAPLDEALGAIARRLGLVLELDRESLAARGVAPREIVRAQVHDVSRDALLDAVVQPSGLRWKITGDRLRVFAP